MSKVRGVPQKERRVTHSYGFPLFDLFARFALARPFRLLAYTGTTILMVLAAGWLLRMQDIYWPVIDPQSNHVGKMRLFLILTLLDWRLLIPVMTCLFWIRPSQIRLIKEAIQLTPLRLVEVIPAIISIPVLAALLYNLMTRRPISRSLWWYIYTEVPEEWLGVLRIYLYVSSFWATSIVAVAVTMTFVLCRFSRRLSVFIAASLLPIGIATCKYTAYYVIEWIGLNGFLQEGIVRVLCREVIGGLYTCGIMFVTILPVTFLALRDHS